MRKQQKSGFFLWRRTFSPVLCFALALLACAVIPAKTSGHVMRQGFEDGVFIDHARSPVPRNFHEGELKVTIYGPADVFWRFTPDTKPPYHSKDYYRSGDTVVNIPVPRLLKIQFSKVDGWETPAILLVYLSIHKPRVHESVTYIRSTGPPPPPVTPPIAVQPGIGILTVLIDGPSQARWSLGGKGRYRDRHVLRLPARTHAVSFSNVIGWTTPDKQVVTVLDGEEVTAQGHYTREADAPIPAPSGGSGTLWVGMTGPAEARWYLHGQGVSGTYRSGQQVGLKTGIYTVSFSNVEGWITPGSRRVTVNPGRRCVVNGPESYSP